MRLRTHHQVHRARSIRSRLRNPQRMHLLLPISSSLSCCTSLNEPQGRRAATRAPLCRRRHHPLDERLAAAVHPTKSPDKTLFSRCEGRWRLRSDRLGAHRARGGLRRRAFAGCWCAGCRCAGGIWHGDLRVQLMSCPRRQTGGQQMVGLANRCIRKPAYPKVSPPLPPIGVQRWNGRKKAAR
jgi:hypothetical protein